jgi:aminobenzoyl-glutamate utilization protein B
MSVSIDPEVIAVARECWAPLRPVIERLFAQLWREPELSNMERRASTALVDWLATHGFEVTKPVCGLPTAFIARRKLGDGPTIALLAEYDALPGIDNDAVPYRQRRGLRAGHACGHNQIGPANCGAAIAAAAAAERLAAAGEIVVVGCPAEEIVWGKIALLARGAFDSVDTILTSHADYQNGVLSRPCQSVIGGEFVFIGVSGHGGSVHRRNALDAAELAVQSIERLRAHHFPDASVEHVLRIAGHIPNVTPDEARLWVTARHLGYERAKEVYDFVAYVCEQAARLTHVEFRHQFIAGTRGYLPNDTIAHFVYAAMQRVGPPRWSDEALEWMGRLTVACRPDESMSLDHGVGLYCDGLDPYGQDDGEASWRIPLGRVNWAIPNQVPLHNWAMAALAGYEGSNPGPLMASETLAIATAGLLRRPDIIAAAKEEVAQRTETARLGAPDLGAVRTMTQSPETFWDGSWQE